MQFLNFKRAVDTKTVKYQKGSKELKNDFLEQEFLQEQILHSERETCSSNKNDHFMKVKDE